MSEIETAEKLGQMAVDVGAVDQRDLQSAWGELGTQSATVEQFAQVLVRKGLLTNYQLDRLSRGLKSGYVYGPYKVLYLVGAGTFARVFRAVHKTTGKVYAVKVLRQRQITEGRADLFRREGELGAKLKHENIVPIHEVVAKPSGYYIVMDFIEGQNLRESFQVRRQFGWADACGVIGGVLSGLHYAFQQGVTHRDLKMSNVLISSDGVAKLIDFGLAALDSTSGGEKGVDRTVEYAALEKATGVRKDDTRSDVYFAGYMLHQMLTGVSTLPTGRDRDRRLGRDTFLSIKPVMEIAPDTPMPVAMVVSKALEFDPEKRYQTPGDMLTDLKIAIRRTKTGAAAADANRAELVSREGFDADGKPRRLMVIESDIKRQDVLRELFKRNGYRVLVSSDPQRALARLQDDPTVADVVLVSSGAIGRPAVDCFNQLGADAITKKLPAVLLLDEPHADWAPDANTDERHIRVTMPVKLRQLREIMLAAVQPDAV